MDHARLACLAVKRDPSRLILLGVKPDRDEPEYGYLLPNKKPLAIGPDMSEISWFIEKPDPKTARRLTRAGGLWNTMIMVFKTKTMLHWVSRLAPRLYQQFLQIYVMSDRYARRVRRGSKDLPGIKPNEFFQRVSRADGKKLSFEFSCSPSSRSLVERLGNRKPHHGCSGKDRQSSAPGGIPTTSRVRKSRASILVCWKSSFRRRFSNPRSCGAKVSHSPKRSLQVNHVFVVEI